MSNSQQLLERRVEKVLPSKEALQKLLSSGKKLRLYQGFDPTGNRLHLGHTVGLRKLMDFANAGHEVIFLFGTGTVLVGDPSERATGRKLISQKEIDQNIKNWQKQVEPIVDFSKVKIRQNGDWLLKLTLKDIIKIASNISAVQLFKRDSFKRRINKGDTVWYHETMYPLLQGYDSVVMDVDLEVGGTDQEFNMLVGRELMKKMKSKEKFVLTTPMILGIDGKQMSKTSDNCVWLDGGSTDMFGKIMSIPDSQIMLYMELVTDIPSGRIKEIDQLIRSRKLSNLQAKKELALSVTTTFHGSKKAEEAKAHFEQTVQKKQTPQSLQAHPSPLTPGNHKFFNICKTHIELEKGREFQSNGQIKRVIEQGGASLNGSVISDPQKEVDLESEETYTIKYGKRLFVKFQMS